MKLCTMPKALRDLTGHADFGKSTVISRYTGTLRYRPVVRYGRKMYEYNRAGHRTKGYVSLEKLIELIRREQ